MAEANPRFDAYFTREQRWRDEFVALRRILLGCDLTEALKWRQVCYTHNGANIVIVSGFKAFCALGFFKGALLPDPKKLLDAPGPNSKAARLLRFTGLAEIEAKTATIRAFVRAAIAVEQQGLKVDFSANKIVTPPAELLAAFKADAALKQAWSKLTPGRQRGWVLQFEGSAVSATRTARILKAAPKIKSGEGPHDGAKKKRAKI